MPLLLAGPIDQDFIRAVADGYTDNIKSLGGLNWEFEVLEGSAKRPDDVFSGRDLRTGKVITRGAWRVDGKFERFRFSCDEEFVRKRRIIAVRAPAQGGCLTIN